MGNVKFAVVLIALIIGSVGTIAQVAAEKEKSEPSIKKASLNTEFGSDLPMLKDAIVRIKSYDKKSKTYLVDSPEFPGEGQYRVTPEGLTKAWKAANLERLKSKPESVVGLEFKADQDLPTLFDEEVKARKGK